MLRIGWASRDITPERPVMLHGQHYVRVSTHANDPITVTALAIEQEGEQALMLSCDICRIPPAVQAKVREEITARLPEVKPEMLFMHATHTHTAPVMDEGLYTPPEGADVLSPTEYVAFLVQRLTDAAEEAWQTRRASKVGWAFSHAVVGHNRRAVYADGTAVMYGKSNEESFLGLEGCEDHSVQLLFTLDEHQRPTGVVINLACPSQVSEHEYYVSADYWHEVRLAVRKKLGQDLFIWPMCSAAGDQSPHFLLYGAAERDRCARKGFTVRQEIGERLARAVDDGLSLLPQGTQMEGPFRHQVAQLNLPARRISEAEYQAAQADVRRLSVSQEITAARQLAAAERVVKRYETQGAEPAPVPVEVHVLRLGEIAIATNPFELYLDYGLRIKGRSPAILTFLAQQSAGACQYLPTARGVQGGHYSAKPHENLVGPEGGQVLVDSTVSIINAFWEESGA